MRILVDARHLRSGGIGRWLRGVVAPWLAGPSGGEGAAVEHLVLAGRPEELEPWLRQVAPAALRDGRASIAAWDAPMYSARAQLTGPLRLRSAAAGCDAAFFPHYDLPLLGRLPPSVVTVHDLTQFLLPEHYPRRKRWTGRLLLRGAVRSAARLVTVSDRSKRDLVEHGGAPDHRVTVVPVGIDETFRPLDEAEHERALARWSSLRPFLLAVAPDRPHKNLVFAVDILERLVAAGEDLRLVRVGPPEPGPADARAREKGLENRMVALGRVDDGELRELYALGEALLFPSLYEGYGLPPLEARACSTPALAAPEAAAAGAAEPAGVAVLPTDDPAAWADAVARLRTEPRHPPPAGVLPTWEHASARVLDELRAAASFAAP